MNRATVARTWTTRLTPKALAELDARTKVARGLKLLPAGGREYQVMYGCVSEVVKLNDKFCSCNEWAVTGLPCMHAIACINHDRLPLEDFCDEKYTVASYLRTYENILHPLPSDDCTPDDLNTAVLPPVLKRRPGRPRLVRIKEAGEEPSQKRSSTVKCGKCGLFGHNARTCQGAPTKKQKLAAERAHKAQSGKGKGRAQRSARSNKDT